MFYELESSAIERYKKSEGFIDIEDSPLPTGRLQRLIWSTFEYPETSRLAFVVSVVSSGYAVPLSRWAIDLSVAFFQYW